MDAIPLEEEDSMQCDITNIIRDTGPPPSSGMASRADSNITTPANCHSDNDELDDRISVKSSLNPSRESSIPPEDIKRETPQLTKCKDSDVTPPKLKIKLRPHAEEGPENSPVIKTEAIEPDSKTNSEETKSEEIESIKNSGTSFEMRVPPVESVLAVKTKLQQLIRRPV